MLAIKLQRIGKKHQPSYRLVVAESRSKMAAPPVEDLGSYNPFTKMVTLKKDRATHWVKMGAQPTTTVHNLLVAQGVLTSKKLAVKMPKAVEKVAEPEVEVMAEATPAEAAEVKEEIAEEVKAEAEMAGSEEEAAA